MDTMAASLPSPDSKRLRFGHAARAGLLLMTLFFGLLPQAQADTLKMAIPPFFPQQEIIKAFQPLADYITKQIGTQVQLVTFPNYLAFWQATRNGSKGFDVALDSAPVTDFRVQRQQWHVIAKLQGVVTQSLVTGPDTLIVDPNELINKKVAVQPSPSVSALLLYQLFPNPVQQPVLVFETTSRDAAKAVIDGKAKAAVIPTPIAAGYPNLNLVTTTKPVPFLAISVAPSVDDATANKLRKTLTDMADSPTGEQILKSSQLSRFVPANNKDYAGESKLLEGTYGY